jgi:glycosyltransferase involved in cell wall biosynthesis
MREVIVVDDGSSDKSTEIARCQGCKIISTKVSKGRGSARNIGVKNTKTELILFCDSSNLISPEFAEKGVSHFKDPSVSAVFGRIKNDKKLKDPFSRWRAKHLFREYLPHRKDVHEVNCLITYAVILRKNAIEEVGNFDERLKKCEDIDLGKRLIARGLKILSDPSLCAYSIRKETMLSLCLRYNRWFSSDTEKSFRIIPTFWNTLRSCYRIYAKEDIKSRDFGALAISLLMPFWLTAIGLLTPNKLN